MTLDKLTLGLVAQMVVDLSSSEFEIRVFALRD
jgi:hypothetical protein